MACFHPIDMILLFTQSGHSRYVLQINIDINGKRFTIFFFLSYKVVSPNDLLLLVQGNFLQVCVVVISKNSYVGCIQ